MKIWLLLWLAQALGPGSIQGTLVRAGTTQPLSNVAVELQPTGAISRTDASGKFTFPAVPAGRYTLKVEHEGARLQIPLTLQAGQDLKNLTLRMSPSPGIFGTVYDQNGERLAASRVQAFQLIYSTYGQRLRSVKTVLTDDFGDYRLFWIHPGEYYVAASYSEADRRSDLDGLRFTPNLTKADEGYSMMYFGGSFTANPSQKVTLTSGRNVENVNIFFKDGPRFTVSGELVGPSGPACARIALVPEGGIFNEKTDFVRDACGAFQIRNVSPGAYVLLAAGEKIASDIVRVNVANRDIATRISLSRTADIRGTVRGSGANLQGVQVTLVRTSRDVDQRFQAAVNPNGAFTIPDVAPGEFDVLLHPLPDSSYIRTLTYGFVDVLAGRMRVDGGSATSIQIVLSTPGGTVEGTVIDRLGQPVSGAQVVLVPGTLKNREDRYKLITSDTAGTFRITGVAPGSYTAFAFEAIEAGAYFAFAYDQALYNRYAAKGVPVSFNDLRNQTIKLTAIPGEETSGGLR